jgi:hypothetical protein
MCVLKVTVSGNGELSSAATFSTGSGESAVSVGSSESRSAPSFLLHESKLKDTANKPMGKALRNREK